MPRLCGETMKSRMRWSVMCNQRDMNIGAVVFHVTLGEMAHLCGHSISTSNPAERLLTLGNERLHQVHQVRPTV